MKATASLYAAFSGAFATYVQDRRVLAVDRAAHLP